MVDTAHDLRQNHLLAAPSAGARERVFPHLRLVAMPLGKVLYEPGDLLTHVYFPTDCIVSLLYVLTDGSSTEISVVGNDGVIGITLFMGGETTPSRALVQSGGHAYELHGQLLKNRDPSRWVDAAPAAALHAALITPDRANRRVQIAITRWTNNWPLAPVLLVDRLRATDDYDGAELIANVWGAASGVTEAAGKLRESWCSQYRRGQITVIDRPRLEPAVLRVLCGGRKESDRLLPHPSPEALRSAIVRLVPRCRDCAD